MKKLSFILVIFSLFVFVGCSDKKLDEIDIPDTGISDDTDNPDSTDSTDDSGDSQNNGDEDSADSTDDSGDSQSDDDADSADSTNDSGDSQSDDDADSADSANDSGDSQSDDDADSADSTNDSGDSQNDDDADSTDSDNPAGCTKIYLNPSFYTYLNGQYLGQVMGGSLGDTSVFDLVILELNNIATTTSYDLSSDQAILTITQDYGESTQKEYFQESGTITVNNYNSETFEMSAVISAKLANEDGSCIEIVSATVKAVDNSGKTETCADIKKCMDECKENSTCAGECYIKSTPLARTQYNDLLECNEANSCNGNYRCWYEHCTEQEEICGMGVDSNYAIPYGSVTINGSFPYLYGDPKPVTVDPETEVATETELPEDETKITIDNDHVLMGAFATGAFGNNNTDIIADEEKVFYYAQISHFSDSLITNNITLVQTYQGSDKKTPTVHLVTTATEPAELTLGLGKWTTEARIFVKGTKSDGTSCDHAFGVGTVNISAIGWTVGATTITVTGEAELYSYRATPDYGGDISGDYWVACDPE